MLTGLVIRESKKCSCLEGYPPSDLVRQVPWLSPLPDPLGKYRGILRPGLKKTITITDRIKKPKMFNYIEHIFANKVTSKIKKKLAISRLF
ncbi:MAG: hypothetical protein BWY64_02579 [bacterium ADurb.Bin363]|nr:MAG: hypothetical protein BWY64_02579 [bacterium ADurb.Bin363]